MILLVVAVVSGNHYQVCIHAYMHTYIHVHVHFGICVFVHLAHMNFIFGNIEHLFFQKIQHMLSVYALALNLRICIFYLSMSY